MNPKHFTPLGAEEEAAYSYAIGGVFINFGAVEMMSYRWVEWLSTDPVVMRDMAIDMKLADRIRLIVRLVERTDWPADDKKSAVELWQAVGTASQIRNRIAHNPFIRGRNKEGQPISGIGNAKAMKGKGPYEFQLLGPDEIEAAAHHAGELGTRLLEIIRKYKGTEIK
jgi:hypothetical protein